MEKVGNYLILMIESIKYKLIRIYQLIKNGWSYYDKQGNFSDFPYWIEDTVFQRFIDEWPESRWMYDNRELDKVYDWIVFDLWYMQERVKYLEDRTKKMFNEFTELYEIEEKIMNDRKKMLKIISDNLYDVSW